MTGRRGNVNHHLTELKLELEHLPSLIGGHENTSKN